MTYPKSAAVEPAGRKGPCDAEQFDPNSLPDGIEPSDDPILKVRTDGYAISYSRRLSQ